MLVELEFLVCARSFEKLRFEACCELVASGRLAGDWREIETFVLSARDSMVSPPVLFEKLPTSRSQALVAAMGVVAEGVSRGRVTTAVTMREMMEVLAAVAGKEMKRSEGVAASLRTSIVEFTQKPGLLLREQGETLAPVEHPAATASLALH